MDHQAEARIREAALRDPDSSTATSGFADRAQEAAHRNAAGAGDDEDDEAT
jgi:hypothetical protein